MVGQETRSHFHAPITKKKKKKFNQTSTQKIKKMSIPLLLPFNMVEYGAVVFSANLEGFFFGYYTKCIIQ